MRNGIWETVESMTRSKIVVREMGQAKGRLQSVGMPVRIWALVNSHSGATEGFRVAEARQQVGAWSGWRHGGGRPVRQWC